MKKIRMKNQILSLILVIVMIIGCFPVTGMATVSSAPPTKGERGESRIEARGTPITIEAGTESGKTVVWYGDSSNKTYVTDNGAAGEDLSNYIIYAGYYNLRDSDDAALTGSITMTGGTVKGIVAANLNGIQPMTTELRITGGQVEDIYFASVSGSNTGTAFGYITVSSDPWYEGNFTDGIYKSEEDEWILIGSAQIPAGENLTIAEGETLTVDRGEVLTNNGTIRNSGSLIINGSFVDNGTVDNTGIITRNAAYIVTDAEGAVTVLADGKSVSPITEYVDGKLYLYDIRGRIKATLNGKDYCGIQTDGSSTQLIEGYSMVTDISGIPESLNVNRPTTLAAVLSPAATTFDTEINYTLTDAGTTQAVLSGNVLTAYNSGTVKLLVVASDGLESYSETFTIPVTYKAITGLSSALPASVIVGSKILLPKVTPTDASYQEIQWSVLSGQEETGATIANGYLVLTKEGTATVQATVKNGKAYGEDYTETFSVTATGITGAIDISQGDVSIEENTDGSFRVTYSGFSGGYKDYKENEWIAITGSTDKYKIEVLSGNPNIALSDCSISHSKSALSLAAGTDVALTLVGTNVLKGTDGSGIYVPVGAVITIGGEGSLSATGGDHHAAIGGMGGASRLMGAQGSGTITINSGTITAQGGYQATGIGAGRYNANGTVIINGGVVTATGGAWAAGIGGGYINDNKTYITGGIIEINGGFVTATGGELAAGIGGSQRGSGNKVTITGGTVVATGGRWGAGIGGGGYGSGGTVVISGGNVLATRGSDANDIGAGNKGSGITLTDANENSISKNTITLDGAAADTAVTAAAGLSYGLKDVKTLNTNQLYFYLPSGTAATSVTAGEKVYDCTEDNQTYYASHDWSKNDSECTRCGETCEHENQTGSTCEICGTALHTHNWTYTKDGNKITATCDAAGCTNKDGGYVTISAPSDLTYTDSKIEAVVEDTLTTGVAVNVEYSDNTTDGYPVNVGEYTASITIDGNEISVDYTIVATSIEGANVTVGGTYTYDGTAKEPTDITVTLGGKTLTKDTDYTVSKYSDNVNAGTAKVIIKGMGNYEGEATGTFTITDEMDPTGEIKIGENGWKTFINKITFGLFYKNNVDVTVTADGTGSDVAKVEYLLSSSALDENNMPADGWTEVTGSDGEYKFSIEPANKGSVYVRITDEGGKVAVINSEGIVVYTDAEADTESVSTTYKAGENKAITVKLNGNAVKSVFHGEKELTGEYCNIDTMGTITLKSAYLDTLSVGEYSFTVYYNPMGETTDKVTMTTTFTLTVEKASIADAKVEVSGSYTYTGKAHTPEPTVTLNGRTLAKGVDYTVSYSKNLEAGKATVTVSGKGNYKDSASTTFEIGKAELTGVAVQNVELTYNGTEQTPDVSASATTVDGSNATFTYSMEQNGTHGDMPSFTNAGTYTVYYKATASNHGEKTGSFTVTVNKATVNEPTIVGKAYTGNALAADIDDTDLYTVEQNEGGTAQGSYPVVLKLKDAANYKWSSTNDAEVTLQFVISAAKNSWTTEPSISGWTYGQSANTPIYEAKFGTVKVVYTGKANDGSDYSSETAPTKAGSYKATFTVEGTADYSGLSEWVVDFTIAKATYNMDGAKWNYTDDFKYDGKEKTVEVIGLPEGVKVSSYEGNKETVVGNYTAKVSFSYDGNNYNAPELADLNWSIKNEWTPAVDTEYTVSTPNANGWLKADLVITAADGYELSLTNTATDEWSETLSGAVEGEDSSVTFYVRNKADGTISLAKTENYKLDKNTETTTTTGKVEFAERTGWEEFLNAISFGLFYKDEVTVKITANDTLSGVANIEYYEADEEKTLDEVKAITNWTAYNDSFGVSVEDAKKFVYFVRITDNAGNVTYLSTDGAEYDTTDPKIEGVENGATYYTTQVVTVEDKNLASVELDGETVTLDNGTLTLAGNVDATYAIKVTDKAGNITEYTVTMKTIAALTESLDDITVDDVTSDDKENIEQVIGDIDEQLANDDLTEDEKAALEETKEKAQDLLDKLDEAANADDTENTEKVKDITADNVTPEDKSDLEKAKDDLVTTLDEYSDNLTEDEKKAIQTQIDRIDKAIATLEKVEAVEDKIGSLPENITKNDEAAIKAADEALGALSDYEKSLVDKDAKKALDDAKAALAELNKPADTTYPNTGDNVNLWLWFALLFVSGGGLFGAAAYKKRQQVKEN